MRGAGGELVAELADHVAAIEGRAVLGDAGGCVESPVEVVDVGVVWCRVLPGGGVADGGGAGAGGGLAGVALHAEAGGGVADLAVGVAGAVGVGVALPPLNVPAASIALPLRT